MIEVSGSHVAIWRRYPFHGQERIIQFDIETGEYEKYTGPDRARGDGSEMKAVALIDGEHYPPVVRDALAALPYEWVGAILVGGTEKLRAAVGDGIEDYGVPLVDGFDGAEIVVDLSDEPVLGPVERFRWASRALAAGLPVRRRRLPLRPAARSSRFRSRRWR